MKSGHDGPHTVIRDEDGGLLVDEDQVTARCRRHWAELLHGQETSWSELAKVASEYAVQHTGRKRMDLLTFHDVQAAKRQAPAAFPFLCQAGGESSARILLTLLNTTRVMADQRWPCVVVACKSSTKTKVTAMKQNHTGAMHASFLKRDIDEHYMKFIHETQCGCAKGRGTCMAGQIVELAANFSKGRGKCWGRLYLDLSEAFDSILREFLIADSTYDVQQLQSSLKALNISDETRDQIVREGSNEMPVNDDLVVWTKRGSRQGCPLGGIAFNLMYEQVLRKIRTAEIMYHPAQPPWNVSSEAKARIDELTRHDTRNWIAATFADVTFVDDACFSFEADNPVSLVNAATMLLQIVDETCEAHGLLVNMNDGKTEFLIEMTGVGARKQFKRLWREDRKAHCISTKTGKSARVVSRYKHVGTIRTRTQNPRDDAETKANSALTAYHQLAHSVFRNSSISLHLREQLANSLCISSLKFGVETWLFTTPGATAQIHIVRMRIGRGLIGQSRFSSCDNTTDAEVLDELRWLPTDLLLLRVLSQSCTRVAASSGKRFAGWQSEQWDHFWTT